MAAGGRRRRSGRIYVGVAAVLAVAAAPAASALAPPAVIAVSPPQGSTVGFATPQLVSVQGQALSFLNADTMNHTLTALATKVVKFTYAGKVYVTRVPLFDSGVVASAAESDVKGVAGLKPGTYQFQCANHIGMKGTLTVQAAGARAAGRS
jgi:plastocyanin